MIKLKDVVKEYDLGAVRITALKGISLYIKKGDFVTIMGPSGSGKSSLLHILGLLDKPTSGEYKLEDHEVSSLADRELSRIRNQHFGFVFQSFNLFPEFNALDNVIMPMIYAKVSPKERKEKAKELLASIGLDHRMYHFPNMLSGGEQQRVAIARSLANNPDLILADEPTGNLPSHMGAKILEILDNLNKDNVTVIMVTHNEKIGRCGKRMIRLRDGNLVSDQVINNRTNLSEDLHGE